MELSVLRTGNEGRAPVVSISKDVPRQLENMLLKNFTHAFLSYFQTLHPANIGCLGGITERGSNWGRQGVTQIRRGKPCYFSSFKENSKFNKREMLFCFKVGVNKEIYGISLHCYE